MAKEPKIIVRFEISSDDMLSSETIHEVLKVLPGPESYYIFGEQKILSGGRVFSTVNKESSINFRTEINTFKIEDCDKAVMEQWKAYVENLKIISEEYHYNFFLNYEVTVYDLNYPAFVFNTDFIKFIADLNINFSMYFYNDESSNLNLKSKME